jgi:hypothetical protein
MLEITNFRDGAVLNHQNGKETEAGLEIEIQGLASSQASVAINGQPAEKNDRFFRGKVLLTKKLNQITVMADDAFGVRSQTIELAYDKSSFKRYNFFLDDCSFFLMHLAKDRPASIFDEYLLHGLKRAHDSYGTKFTLNLFYHDDHHDFCIADMPDCYKSEFTDNADWLRMSFHSKSEFPDRPYQSADAATLAADYDLIRGEVLRFAGEKSFICPLVIHWGMTNPENFHVLQERGVNVLTGGFIGAISHIGETHTTRVTDIGYHYEKDIAEYISKNHLFYDRHFKIFLMNNLICCNYDDIDVIRDKFAALAQEPRDTIGLMTHEQYTYQDYFNYIPNHLDRLDFACRCATEAGYQPVYFAEDMFGNPAWNA